MESVRDPRCNAELIHFVVEYQPQRRNRHLGTENGIDRGCYIDDVAEAVDQTEVRGTVIVRRRLRAGVIVMKRAIAQFGNMLRRQQFFDWHFDKGRISVLAAVDETLAHNLDQAREVRCRIHPQPGDMTAREHPEYLEDHPTR